MMRARKYEELGGSDHVGLFWIIMRALVLILSGWGVGVIGKFCTEW